MKATARPQRLNKDEPRAPVAVPEAPVHLDGRARTKFAEMAEMLARYGVMTELDSGAFARYAVIWCRWVDAEDAVGPTVTTVAGNLIQNLSLANRCLSQLAQIEREFGLTPSSRTRVRAVSPPRETDPIAAKFFSS